jgi:hypothetical protein
VRRVAGQHGVAGEEEEHERHDEPHEAEDDHEAWDAPASGRGCPRPLP